MQGYLKHHRKARKDALKKPPETCKDALVDPAKHSTMLYKAPVDPEQRNTIHTTLYLTKENVPVVVGTLFVHIAAQLWWDQVSGCSIGLLVVVSGFQS